tara:strand:+ start:378 stop:509 length:132 start_codon:yes stop_codon:yes gene_type:complete
MPKVGKVSYPYTKAGIAAANKAKKKKKKKKPKVGRSATTRKRY